MVAPAPRTFEDTPATRSRTPLLTGIVGPSGTGKTYSALRLAEGIQRVSGGDIHVIDSEAKRALHYADEFKFRHVPFAAPFGPLDYLAAIQHCRSKGAGVIIVDSTSHEHEGQGGVLEIHEAEVERMCRGDMTKAEANKLRAWARPKAERRELINAVLQMEANFIFCFRAKEKLKVIPGKQPQQMGFCTIGAEEFIYEFTANFLLIPGADGYPCWKSEYEGERATMKLPKQFRDLFKEPRQLSQEIGQYMAEWSAGTVGKFVSAADKLAARFKEARTRTDYAATEEAVKGAWKTLNTDERKRVTAERDLAKQAIAEAEKVRGQGADPSTDEPPLN